MGLSVQKSDRCRHGSLPQRSQRIHSGTDRSDAAGLLQEAAAVLYYELEMLDTTMPFAELRERCLVNARAELADQADDFSLRIRDGIPLPEPYTMQEFLNPP